MSIQIESNVKDPDRVRERRQQIVDAAVRLFSEKGFHKTTTREIAKASGLSNGALYEYVTSKEDILFLVCQHIHTEMERQLNQSLREGTTGAARLRHAIQAFIRVVDDMQADILLIYQETKSLPRAYLREVLQQEQHITETFAQLLADGVNDRSLAIDRAAIHLLAHNIVATSQMWAFRRWALSGISLQEFTDQQTEMLMSACSAAHAQRQG